ncbi:MAG: DUF3683 domain-containing protein, partial [Deltaproteobacteria bacterium]|nr:DUF3683 domain-containing protein [Deltaproteobacteria bacterium]
MDEQKKYREIPYNYTSFSDREIILRYFDSETWDVLNELRNKRVTGRSAKLLFEVVGDIFVIDRNPYIFNDFLDNPIKQKRLKTVHNRKLAVIAKGSGDSRVKLILDRVANKSREFFKSFKKETERRKEISSALCKIVKKEDLFFTAFHKVFHATDATDWRVEFPEAVIYPSTEDEISRIVKKVPDINMKIVPRGGGTGLTGGAVPVQRQTLVVNTERLSHISEVTLEKSGEVEIPVVEAGAGAVTEIVTKFCKERGYIFATDPTSSWASTIGGNIAENCGGKKAVMWGTAIDNIFSFTIVNSSGEIIEVVRKDHPHRKINEDDQVTFNVFNKSRDGELLKTITLKGDEIRKKGVGKDITNKALGGIPGIQKEGGDGIITSAKFVLYRPFNFSKTLCLEFYGDNLVNASKAIVAIREKFKKNKDVFLLALEHFDDKYAQAVNYKNKSARRGIPKAVLLIDLESNDEALLNSECNSIEQMVKQYECEGFTAKDSAEKKIFWKDRKNLGAIARHTNAFKLNEDVVIPIESLPEFADFIESLNNEKLAANNLLALNQIK